ncbi:MAG: beta-ketoacyl synthase N-terminal-like domain-containing protein, partial [Saprospiraceae bacterium]
MQEAYIVAYTRSAVAKAKKGGFRFLRSDDLAVMVIQDLLKKVPQLDPTLVDDLIVGCANPEGEQGLQIGRQISLRALGEKVPGMTVNRYCASGLETIAIATAKIRAGMGECFIAGGVENMSQIPMEGYKLALNYEVADKHPDYIIGMGLTAEAVAKKYNISREAQDEFALRSHQLSS